HPAWVHVEAQRSFYKYGPTRDDLRALLEEPAIGRGCDLDVGGVLSIHLWHARWAEWWRRDFTRVHEGLLTESFIRRWDATFALRARRFVPELPTPGLPATGTARRHAGTDRTSTSPARPVRPVISRLDDVLTRSGTWWQARRAWQAQRKRR